MEAADTQPLLAIWRSFSESPEITQACRERVDIMFDGYNADPRELYEIDDVRTFVHQLNEAFPYWLYFLSKQRSGLKCLLRCLLPNLTTRDRAQAFPGHIAHMLEHWWFPAMNQMCAFAGLPEDDTRRLTDQTFAYILHGRLVDRRLD